MQLLKHAYAFALKSGRCLSSGTRCELCGFRIYRKKSHYTSKETIFSLSSGHGKCGVAIIRVSGSKALDALKTLGRYNEAPKPRYAELRTLYDETANIPIDHGLVLWFPGPKSFTGEDCVEFQVHGGPAVITAVATALGKISGLRQAEAGEFTKRAFMNNKLDLTEIEGLGDLIHAETETQRRQALRQMEGSLGRIYNDWRSRLIKTMANVEAFIDFSENENIEEDLLNQVNETIDRIIDEINNHLRDNRRGERLRSGVRVTILGEPNVGKSSLLNLIAQRPAAIVSDIAGTTRDIVESAVNIGDYPVLLSDTAGLRESEDVIEKEGVKRAIERAKSSDLKVVMLSASEFEISIYSHVQINLEKHVKNVLKHLGLSEDLGRSYHDSCSVPNWKDDIVIVLNKCDLISNIDLDLFNKDGFLHFCLISCATNEGIFDFLEILKNKIKQLCGDPLTGNPSLTQARHRQHLSNCVTQLERYQQFILKDDVVIAAECLRLAIREIGKITGKITSEDILDVIFQDFCIGK